MTSARISTFSSSPFLELHIHSEFQHKFPVIINIDVYFFLISHSNSLIHGAVLIKCYGTHGDPGYTYVILPYRAYIIPKSQHFSIHLAKSVSNSCHLFSLMPCTLRISSVAVALAVSFTAGQLALSAIAAAIETRPYAPLLTYRVNAGSRVELALPGVDLQGDSCSARILTVPANGLLYQLSQVYDTHGYAPELGNTITAQDVAANVHGALVTGTGNRLWYVPPAVAMESDTAWGSFKYTVADDAQISQPGTVWLVPADGTMVSSRFLSGVEGWTISHNGPKSTAIASSTTPLHRALHQRYMSNYIVGAEAEVFAAPPPMSLPRATDDRVKWYFEAPAKFQGHLSPAYGGFLRATLQGLSGDFTAQHENTPAIILECSRCDSGNGVRLAVWSQSSYIQWSGDNVAQLAIPLSPEAWTQDPGSTLSAWAPPSTCAFVQVLAGVTRLAILGDWTRGLEGVGMDNVSIQAPTSGQGPPLRCAASFYV